MRHPKWWRVGTIVEHHDGSIYIISGVGTNKHGTVKYALSTITEADPITLQEGGYGPIEISVAHYYLKVIGHVEEEEDVTKPIQGV